MRESIKQLVGIFAESLPVSEPIYEFGSLQVPNQEGFADIRPFFPGKKYVGCDMREGPGVDLVLNLHDIDLPAETAGTVLALDTLEHVEFARKAVDELHRILKPNGILVISSVMKFPVHGFPHDYWRFTTEGFKSLMRPFDSAFVDFAGDKQFPHTVIGLGFKGAIPDDRMVDFITKLGDWKKRWRKPPGKLRKRLVKLITRPSQVNLFKKMWRS